MTLFSIIFFYINVFLLSMIFFIGSTNFFSILIYWEMIVIFSFLLISFWSKRVESIKSAFKTVFYNKVGDVFLFIGIILIYKIYMCEHISSINLLNAHIFFYFYLFIVPIFSKSIQFIFSF